MRRYSSRDWTTCLHCGKRGWPTRQAARGRYADLQAYMCRHGGDTWNLGHHHPIALPLAGEPNPARGSHQT